MQIAITAHGNLIRLENAGGQDHMIGGDGYVVCSSNTTPSYDAGSEGESGFGNPTITQPNGPDTLPLTIVRYTTDGVFQLTQKFARDCAEKDFTITMTLKNISALTRSDVKLARYFDGTINSTINSSYWDDIWDRSNDSVWGRQMDGLMLTAGTLIMPHSTAVETWLNWSVAGFGDHTNDGCDPIAEATPTPPGVYVGRSTYNIGNLTPNQAKTVKVVYRRF
jgi:hypothetical protein